MTEQTRIKPLEQAYYDEWGTEATDKDRPIYKHWLEGKVAHLEADVKNLDIAYSAGLLREGELEAENTRLREGHEDIIIWGKAYPVGVFTEPDLKKASELLKAGGMTLDAVSASAMRHVLKGVVKIARDALAEEE